MTAAEENAALSQAIFARLPLALVVTDVGGHVLDANAAACRLLGRERGAMLKLAELLPGAPRQALERPNPLTSFELELRTPAGEARKVGVSAIAEIVSDRHLFVLRDLTAQAGAAEVQQRLAATDRLVALGALARGLAHEINNPLAAVIANVDVAAQAVGTLAAARAEPTDALQELLAVLTDAGEAAERVRRAVTDLRIFSRGDDRPINVDVIATLEATRRLVGKQVQKRARLVTEYREVPPVIAEEARLGQVFFALVVDAMRAIEAGPPSDSPAEIRVTTSHDDTHVTVSVHDDGPDLPPGVLTRIFDPFSEGRSGASSDLGLPACRAIVRDLGGELVAQSEPGKGTTLRVRLPIAPGFTAATTRPTEQTPARRRVLVVDDDPAVLRATSRMLTAHHEVFVTSSGKEALNLVRNGEHFDVILCDVMMPEMSGVDLHEAIAAHAPDAAARMVFATGGAFSDRTRAFLSETSCPRLEKPYDRTRLLATIRSIKL